MNNLLVMCPSRGRPKILAEMLKSYYPNTSPENELIVYLNNDDPYLEEYAKLNYIMPKVIVGKRLYLAEAYNYIFSLYPDYKYYCPINDDHYFITPKWDTKLIDIIETKGQGWGLAAAEDNLTDWKRWQHPSGCIISGNIPRTLGYFIWPKIQHIGIDTYFQYLMQGIDRLFHTTDIIIEHRHWLMGKALLDDNYKWVYSAEQQQYGWGMVAEYRNTQLKQDIEKLEEAMKEQKGGEIWL